jgi:hypothetical protein
MNKTVVISAFAFLFFILGLILLPAFSMQTTNQTISGAPPYGEPETAAPPDPYDWLRNWVRPEGPAKVALQVGHWKNEELPEELSRLIGNTGAEAAGHQEADVNLAIAEQTKKILESKGIAVEILPATVPPRYYADAFVAIHADGNEDTSRSGYKSSPPWRDFSGDSAKLNQFIATEYEKATEMEFDDNITRNMRGYYAFSFWRYTHSVHPMTPSVILETGYLTSYKDRQTIVNKPEMSAQGLANGIIAFLESEQLI